MGFVQEKFIDTKSPKSEDKGFGRENLMFWFDSFFDNLWQDGPCTYLHVVPPPPTIEKILLYRGDKVTLKM